MEAETPVVAAIQGAAIGGGLGFALTADFRVAAPEARFAANFARLGFHHGFGLTVTLPNLAGQQHALDLLYTGRRVRAEEALEIGLCDALVLLEELRDKACEMAEEIAMSAPLAVRSIRRTMRRGLAEQFRLATDHEQDRTGLPAPDERLRRGRPRHGRAPHPELRGELIRAAAQHRSLDRPPAPSRYHGRRPIRPTRRQEQPMPDQPSELTVLDALPVHPGDAPDPATWRLRVDGLVGQPLDIDLDGLLAMPQQLMVDDFACLEGWTVPGIRWRGVTIADLLDRAGAPPEAAWVQVTADDFSIPLPIADARAALLAVEANDEPLPGEHGGPARLVVPGGECFTSIKWTDHIEVRAEPGDNSARRIALDRLESE